MGEFTMEMVLKPLLLKYIILPSRSSEKAVFQRREEATN
jgi:hypothetical protein